MVKNWRIKYRNRKKCYDGLEAIKEGRDKIQIS
jgi:hypothetical protein